MMRCLLLIISIAAPALMFSQVPFPFDIFYPVYDTTTFDQPAAIQDDSSLVFIGGYNVVSSIRMRPANLMYAGKEIVARFQISPDKYMNTAKLAPVEGNMENDDVIKSFIVKGSDPGDSLFLIYSRDSLTLQNIYPYPAERPSRRCIVDGHDIGLSKNGYAAITYRYDTMVNRYGNTAGQFETELEEIVVSDASHRKVKEIELINLFPPEKWNMKRSMRAGIDQSLKEPFHINSIQFVDDTILLVSARSLGLFSYDWKNGTLDWFLPEDTFGTSPVLQHNLRYLGKDTYSFFSDGDSLDPTQGVVIRHNTEGWVVSRVFNPFQGAGSFGMGSYQTDSRGSLDVINTGVEKKPSTPFKPAYFSTRTQAVKDHQVVFDLSIAQTGCYSSRYIHSTGWGNELIIKHTADGKVTLTARHPITRQIPIWYGSSDSSHYQVIGKGDTLQWSDSRLVSVFYVVAANDATGWYFQSRKAVRSETGKTR